MYILEMSQLCYDFEKWSIFTLSAILAVNLVGLALLLSQWLELETIALFSNYFDISLARVEMVLLSSFDFLGC